MTDESGSTAEWSILSQDGAPLTFERLPPKFLKFFVVFHAIIGDFILLQFHIDRKSHNVRKSGSTKQRKSLPSTAIEHSVTGILVP
jgi:hypothetical protein